ncbi:MAG TPA: lytic transglycosylase domain-containing protein [Acetobacteraceae bacterium]|nr:lytic transglycosylase domain-containing protein [Acetobacteraceae bacterium]
MRLAVPILLLCAALAGRAARAAPDIPALLHESRFAEADALAANYADPVARKLVLYERLLTPGAAGPAEIAAFLAANPDWPNRALLERRHDEALTAEVDDAAARADCTARPPLLPVALARCAAALRGTDPDAAQRDARRAWAEGLDAPEFAAQWKNVLRPEDELARFEHLAAADSPLAAAQIARLAPAERPGARALLALRHGAADAYAAYQALPAGEQAAPRLVLAAARWLRRANDDQEAVALWRARGETAERAAPETDRAAFWNERNALARDLLASGDNADASWLADDRLQTGAEQQAAAAFLTGFIALRRLGDPAGAAAAFRRLAATGPAAITQARAAYWLGLAEAAAGRDPQLDFARAAAYSLTFYGQLASRAAGADETALFARIRALSDPAAPVGVAWDFAGRELIRAAAILSAWGEFGRARPFLLRAAQLSSDPKVQALSARLGLALGLPDAAVAVARRMGAAGHALPDAGWPEPFAPPPPPPDPAVVLAVMRQESSFDAGIVSPAGARGLMQLMPATAQAEAAHMGGSVTALALTADPTRNMELGAAYLRGMLARFDGSLPLAIAAYNAGPRRVQQWLEQNGDPRAGRVDMVDWIELIPFDETRNYVERVLESVVIYEARRNEPAGALTAQWMR